MGGAGSGIRPAAAAFLWVSMLTCEPKSQKAMRSSPLHVSTLWASICTGLGCKVPTTHTEVASWVASTADAVGLT